MIMEEEHVFKLHSVSAAMRSNNKFATQYGDMLWSVALLTAYQCGGYEQLKYNFNNVPIKYVKLLLDAYQYKNDKLELAIAQAASRPHMKKADGQKYINDLVNKLEGKA